MRTNLARTLEFAVWVGAVSIVVTLVLGLISFVFGSGLLSLKYALFVVGFLLFGIGSFGIRARYRQAPRRFFEDVSLGLKSDRELWFETRLHDLPLPIGSLPIADRVGRDVKLFASGLLLLALSLAMETVLGIRV